MWFQEGMENVSVPNERKTCLCFLDISLHHAPNVSCNKQINPPCLLIIIILENP